MLRIIYTSNLGSLGHTDLVDIMVTSHHRRNVAREIRSVIALGGRQVGQVIEGEDDAVAALAAKIQADTKHASMEIVQRARFDAPLIPQPGLFECTMRDIVHFTAGLPVLLFMPKRPHIKRR